MERMRSTHIGGGRSDRKMHFVGSCTRRDAVDHTSGAQNPGTNCQDPPYQSMADGMAKKGRMTVRHVDEQEAHPRQVTGKNDMAGKRQERDSEDEDGMDGI